MRLIARTVTKRASLGLLTGLLTTWAATGCASGGSLFSIFGSPFTTRTGGATGSTQGPSSTGRSTGTGLGGGERTNVDPCTEPAARKFINIALRNADRDDFVHYFLVLIAFVNGETYPDGAVCADDIPQYEAFGYTNIPAGQSQPFGNFCVVGPALLYFHRGGQFRQGGGGAQFASAIPPAQGTTPTFDSFFTSAGARVPIPNLIIFHNPGSGEGAALKISRNKSEPCNTLLVGGESECQQDAFYYVDDRDLMTGSTALGVGSGRRVPSEIQGTGCQCSGLTDAAQRLAPSTTTANSARCNEFLRGGKIDYVFLREDTNPPFPQLVWRVTDASGALVHDFDSRANVP